MRKEKTLRVLVENAKQDIANNNLVKAWKKIEKAAQIARETHNNKVLEHISEIIWKHFSYSTEMQLVKLNPIQTDGLILDIGGGGEGVIGKLNGKQVIAIDINLKELQETRNEALKVVMDATDLKFLPKSFDVCTAFFSFMYIPNNKHLKVFKEIHKVLKDSGKFLIWDAKIPKKCKKCKVFKVRLKVQLPTSEIMTDYGVKWNPQNVKHFKELALKTNFKIINQWSSGKIFHLEMSKT